MNKLIKTLVLADKIYFKKEPDIHLLDNLIEELYLDSLLSLTPSETKTSHSIFSHTIKKYKKKFIDTLFYSSGAFFGSLIFSPFIFLYDFMSFSYTGLFAWGGLSLLSLSILLFCLSCYYFIKNKKTIVEEFHSNSNNLDNIGFQDYFIKSTNLILEEITHTGNIEYVSDNVRFSNLAVNYLKDYFLSLKQKDDFYLKIKRSLIRKQSLKDKLFEKLIRPQNILVNNK